MTVSPIYTKAADPSSRYGTYISAADTARLLRAALARAFPTTHFYVRSETYSGGASIDVYFDGVQTDPAGHRLMVLVDYDGNVLDPRPVTDLDYSRGRYAGLPKDGAPRKRDVDAVTWPFVGGGFDGMIDMAYSVSSWLMPDGSAAVGHSPGTEGSHGSNPGYDSPARYLPSRQTQSFRLASLPDAATLRERVRAATANLPPRRMPCCTAA